MTSPIADLHITETASVRTNVKAIIALCGIAVATSLFFAKVNYEITGLQEDSDEIKVAMDKLNDTVAKGFANVHAAIEKQGDATKDLEDTVELWVERFTASMRLAFPDSVIDVPSFPPR